MFYKSIYLHNYIGIYNGMKLEEIYIDFTKCKNNLVVIKGDNGSGKSTLFKAINVLQDDSNMFIKGRSAKKIVEVHNDGIDYRIEYIHEFKNGGYISKGFFYKGSFDNLELCNPNGNITACKDLIFSEFNLDANFASLSELSSKDRGLVSRIPSARKQNFNNIISGVEAYNQIYKTLSKRSSVFRSMINSIANKIKSIGDEGLLSSSLSSIEQRIVALQATKEEIIASIAKDQNLITMLDPSGHIQESYAQLNDLLQESITEKRSISRILNSLSIKLNGEPASEKVLLSLEASIERAQSDKIDKEQNIARLIAMNEDSSKKLNEKRAKLESLSSAANYSTLVAMKDQLIQEIAESEAFFAEANIVDRSMTSNEYMNGLNTLLDIKMIVDTMKDTIPLSVIVDAIGYITLTESDTIFSYPDINSIEDSLENLRLINQQLSIDLIEYNNLDKIASNLINRPEDCSIPTCYFIKDAVEAANRNPKENIERIETEIAENEIIINNHQKALADGRLLTEAINYIKQVCRYINSMKGTLAKLPNGHIFSNISEFLTRLKNGSDFGEISEIYKYISQAAMFEQYHSSVAKLATVENELKIYKAKNELIEEIVSDIDKIESDINNTLSEIEKGRLDIMSIDSSVLQYRDKAENLRAYIEADSRFKEIDSSIEQTNQNILAIKNSMSNIQTALNNIDSNGVKLENIRTQLSNLERERNQIEYALKQLSEYKIELEEFNAKYEKVEFMKNCSSPTKGIQLIFIELYLRDIIRTANELLSLVLGGEFRLLKPIIDDRSFNFPCVGDGLPHDDISSLSDGQSAIMSVVLSAAIMFHSSTKYNVLKFDEVDGQLDTINRSQFLFMVDQVRSILNCEQCITISHNNELDLRNVDLIILRTSDDELFSSGGNIIFNYNAL